MTRKDLVNKMLVEALAHYFVCERFFELAIDDTTDEEKNIDGIDEITNDVLNAFNKAVFHKQENDHFLMQEKAMERANEIIGTTIFKTK